MGIKLGCLDKTSTDLKRKQSSVFCCRHWLTLHSRAFDLNKKSSCSFNGEVRHEGAFQAIFKNYNTKELESHY